MKVYKFGGASIKDAEGVRNLTKILKEESNDSLLVVISAMGKMTNALEEVVHASLDSARDWHKPLQLVKDFHAVMLADLFPETTHPIYIEVARYFSKLEDFLNSNKSEQHAFVYDQVVCYGELLSSTIVSLYLQENGVQNQWLDARNCIITDAKYRDATVDWEASMEGINAQVDKKAVTITQGFIGSEKQNSFSTTLGREGSDYTAAIFAYCLDAETVSIWKDVAGVYSADPRYFENPTLLKSISYREAIELAFYGATVIHPKTLQPLQGKNIPLYVRSFLDVTQSGTCVGIGQSIDPKVPCFILKNDQILLSLSSLDFSFIMEDTIGEVFKLLHKYKMKVNLIQSSAISFTVCISDMYTNLEDLLVELKKHFRVLYNTDVKLYTIRHFLPDTGKDIEKENEVLLRQQSRETLQLIVR
ncbi:MAG TPA: aspartate kinase [Flavobacteriaceae bacterium]|nr:aspartate kinase [Flavobacteriaceae bacterium]